MELGCQKTTLLPQADIGFLASKNRRKGLRRNSISLLKFVAEVGFTAELEFSNDAFVGVALDDQLLREAAAQFADPLPGSFLKVQQEVAFQLSQGYGTQRRHVARLIVRRFRQRLPVLNFLQSLAHTSLVPVCFFPNSIPVFL